MNAEAVERLEEVERAFNAAIVSNDPARVPAFIRRTGWW
jgi:hypothetical protein